MGWNVPSIGVAQKMAESVEAQQPQPLFPEAQSGGTPGDLPG